MNRNGQQTLVLKASSFPFPGKTAGRYPGAAAQRNGLSGALLPALLVHLLGGLFLLLFTQQRQAVLPQLVEQAVLIDLTAMELPVTAQTEPAPVAIETAPALPVQPARPLPQALTPSSRPAQKVRPAPADKPQPAISSQEPPAITAVNADTPNTASLTANPAAPASPASASASAPVPAPATISPAPQHNPKPDYPPIARKRGLEGTVVLSITVGEDGLAHTVLVDSSSSHQLLDAAAVEAASKWRFRPGSIDGKPMTMAIQIPVTFQLTGS